MSTSGKGLAKLMGPIEPCVAGRGSTLVELFDQLLGCDEPVRRVDQLAHFVPVDLRRGEVQPKPARRSHVSRVVEPAVLVERLAVALVDLDQDRMRIWRVLAGLSRRLRA